MRIMNAFRVSSPSARVACRQLAVAQLASVLIVAAVSPMPALSEDVGAEAWTIDHIIAAVASREESLRGLDVVGSVSKRELDFADYVRARNANGHAAARFYGYEHNEETPRARIQLPPDCFRYRWRSPIELRFDKLTNATRDSETVSSLCYNGNAWNHFTDAAWMGPDRIIDGSANAPVIAEYLGVGGRVNRIGHEAYDYADSDPLSLSRGLTSLLRDAGKASIALVRKNEGATTISVTFLTPRKGTPGKQYAYEIHYQTVISFDPRIAMAPTALTLKTMVRRGDRLVQSPEGGEVSVEWSDFKRLDNSAYVAASVLVTRTESVMLPAKPAGFSELKRDGSRVLFGGEKVVDAFDTKVERFVL
jgi:hypothetical protein